MILDGLNYFSVLASGDVATFAVGDTASGNVIDQGVANGLFSEGGGAYVGMFLKCVIQTALLASGGASSIQVVLQDSADNSSFADLVAGPVVAKANAVIGVDLAGFRVPIKARRYLRVVYRVITNDVTTGKLLTFLTPDQDYADLSQRPATGTVSAPTGAMDESIANGVLNG
jgi:hypothetical protein